MTTTRIEYEQWLRGDDDLIQNEVFKPKEEIKKEPEKPKASSTAKDLFDELFGETK